MQAIKQLIIFGVLTFFVISKAAANVSVCYGATNSGSIKDALALPLKGNNYQVFSQLAWHLGRVYVHSKVHAVILSSYVDLDTRFPEKKFMYGETGWPNGGSFKPHKTHQNGLSVDFMVPVLNTEGQSVYLPTNFSNKWGYDIEFDENSRFLEYKIDYVALAAHLKALHQYAKQTRILIKRVYFDPRLQSQLFAVDKGNFIKQNLNFNAKHAWVRHDEHYHVDFEVGCLPLEE